ncbi:MULTISPECIES: MFS transporter [Streptosporangium]|uniref:MFS family arabinose efflux permease n=1 Tax=Streptosporangium brasiliense TaxID=47480 RepID=A0ABT9R5Z8_9ACTN|nr:MFS transporter [Streptosporangium brasiliense]MDP9864658.1 putative MFS family arabinose efflux permease [Streptosporangium brasiliense]
MTTIAPVQLTRDRATWLVYLQLGVFATYLYGLSAALPMLRIDQGVSQAVAGLHGTAMAVGSILTGLALPWLTRRIGRRAVTWTGLAGMNAGVLLVVAGTALPVTLLGYGIASGMASITLYAGMAALSDHHGPAGAAAISEANAVGVCVGIAAPFVVASAAQTALGWRAALLMTPVLTVLLALTMGRVWIPERAGAEVRPGPEGGARLGWRFHVAGAVLFCCVALEFCFNLWAAKLFADRTGLSAAVAATGLTAFTAGLAAGRFAGARLALWVRPPVLLVGALALTATGWTLFWLSRDPVLSYTGLALSGLGVSLHFPLALSRVLDASGGRPDQATAIASILAGLAVGIGPLLLGALADGFGIRWAFVMVPVLVGLAVGGVLVSSS